MTLTIIYHYFHFNLICELADRNPLYVKDKMRNKIILNIENKQTKINSTEFEVIEKFDKLNLVRNSNSKVSTFLTK